MLRWALIFAIIAIVAGLLGFAGLAAIAKTIFYIFLGLVVVFVILGLTIAKKF
jgi:uncharacterized membrane protein YtjA (UPF0391 family)